MRVRLFRGSVEDMLPTLDAESFDAALCDPPYGLGFMGKAWDHGVPGAAIWAEVERCLRPGAHLLAFGGTRTFHRLTVGIEDGGFEIRDCLAWLYGSGFPKSLDLALAIDKAERGVPQGGADPTSPNHGKFKGGCSEDNPSGRGFGAGPGAFMEEPGADRVPRGVRLQAGEPARWSGYGTALKPAWEPCILAMKPTAGTFAANALAHGVAGLAIDAGRIAAGDEKIGNGSKSMASWRRAEGRTDLPQRPDPTRDPLLGRWPANVLLDEEAAGMLDAQSGELTSGKMLAGTARSARSVCYGAMPDTATLQDTLGDSGGASRFFYTAKADRAERQGSRHPTLKPMDLCAYLARLLLPPVRTDGKPRRILVPFSGAGSEMIGCLRAGWDEVVGIEREAEYVADAERRIRAEFGLLVEMERVA